MHSQLIFWSFGFGWRPIGQTQFKNIIEIYFFDLGAWLQGPRAYIDSPSVGRGECTLKVRLVHLSVVVCSCWPSPKPLSSYLSWTSIWLYGCIRLTWLTATREMLNLSPFLIWIGGRLSWSSQSGSESLLGLQKHRETGSESIISGWERLLMLLMFLKYVTPSIRPEYAILGAVR